MVSSEASPRAASASTGAGPLLIVISGPSGVGKDALLERLRERGFPAHFTVTATTRPQREVLPADHRYLRFMTEADFEKLLADDGLLEHATVYGYHYGVPKAEVAEALAAGRDVIMRVDVQGAATIKRLVPSAVSIFLAPPSVGELEVRLRGRGLDNAGVIRKRLEAAQRELAEQSTFDYVVMNERDRLDEAADRVLAIIEKERSRPGRQPVIL